MQRIARRVGGHQSTRDIFADDLTDLLGNLQRNKFLGQTERVRSPRKVTTSEFFENGRGSDKFLGSHC